MVGPVAGWHRTIALTSLCAVLMGGASLGVSAAPILVTQQLAEPAQETIVDRLDHNSDRLEDGSYYNLHTFEGKARETLTIDLISDDFDAYLILVDPNGDLIARDRDSGEDTHARNTVRIN